MTSRRLYRIPAPLLKGFSEGFYVDSPVYFDAPGWVRWMNWTKLERLYAMAPEGENWRTLDFACGNGIMFPSWDLRGKMTVGIDLHVGAAERVRQHYHLKRVHLSQAQGALLPFQGESFDLVFAASTLEHFSDLTSPLAEIHRVLRRGGHLLFLCPNENRWYGWGRWIAGYEKPADHYHSADEVLTLVRSFFQMEEISRWPRLVPPWFSVYKMARAVKG